MYVLCFANKLIVIDAWRARDDTIAETTFPFSDGSEEWIWNLFCQATGNWMATIDWSANVRCSFQSKWATTTPRWQQVSGGSVKSVLEAFTLSCTNVFKEVLRIVWKGGRFTPFFLIRYLFWIYYPFFDLNYPDSPWSFSPSWITKTKNHLKPRLMTGHKSDEEDSSLCLTIDRAAWRR